MENPGEAAAADALAASLAAQATIGEVEATPSPTRDSAGAEEEEHELCAICSHAPRCVLLTACGHCVTCETCHGEVMTRSAKCVLCNLPILDGGVRLLALGNSDSSAGAPLTPLRLYMPEAIDADVAERARAAANPPRLSTAQQLQQLRALAAVVAEEGNDAAVLLQATRDLRRLLYDQDDQVLLVLLPAAVREDVPLRMVRLLERQDEGADLFDLHMEAVWVLFTITVSAGWADAMVDAGAVPHLLRFAAHPNKVMHNRAIFALGNIAADGPGSRDRLLGIGVLPPLLALLEAGGDAPASLECTRNVVWVLCNLCRGAPPPPFEAMRPVLPALARLAHSGDEQVFTHACWALSDLSNGSNGPNDHIARQAKIAIMLATNVCGRLVELMAHSNSEVVHPALHTIGNLVAGNDDEQTQAVLDHGVLPRLLRLLHGPYPPYIKKAACWTVSNIAAGNKAQIQAVLDANFVPLLIHLLTSAEFNLSIKNEAGWALSNATDGGTHAQIRFLVCEGVIKPICDLLTGDDVRVVTVALTAMDKILKVGACDRDKAGGSVNRYAALVDDAEGLEKIKALRHHANHDIGEKALKLLETFFGPS